MSGFLANNITYNIQAENEISIMLTYFNREFLFNVIKDRIRDAFKYDPNNNPNIVASFENYFKQLKEIYPNGLQEIEATRIDTYRQVIEILCTSFDLSFSAEDDADLYSIAYYMYDFLVGNFRNNIVAFFSNYIVKERNSLYEMYELSQYRKNKDNSTSYNKRIYKNSKLAIINANLEYVIDSICVNDIDYITILNNVYADKNIVRFLMSVMVPNTDLFKTLYVPAVQSVTLRPFLLTYIRLEIQRQSTSEDINILNLK